MAGTMSRADLVADLKDSLHDAANAFTAPADADLIRILDRSALAMGRVRPRLKRGTITVQAAVADYAAPSDLIRYRNGVWDAGKMPSPWEASYPGPLPRVTIAETDTGNRMLFDPAPSALMVALFGDQFPFYYDAGHAIGDNAADTTVAPADRGLLILRGQAEAMRELAMRNVTKPVALRDGITGQPRISTPTFLHQMLLDEFERRAA